MALITCKNCGRPVSDKAPACPHCGAEIEPAATQARPEPGAEFVPDAEDSVKPTISPVVAIIAIAIIAIGAMAGYYLYQQEMERQRAEFVRDSLAQVERERIAAERARIAAEKARQDSIRRVHETIVNGYLEALRREKRNYVPDVDMDAGVKYFLFDITRDGIEDLFIYMYNGWGHGNNWCVIYAFVNGSVKKLQTMGMSQASLHQGGDYIIHNQEIQGTQEISKITYSNGKIIFRDIFKGTCWVDNPSLKGYTYIEDYRKVSEPEVSYINSSNEQPILNMF